MAGQQSGRKYIVSKRYPRFGRGRKYDDAAPPKTVTDSPYYWWYKYLQLHEGYRLTEQQAGVGPCGDVYADLGPVHSRDFKQWWQANVDMFANEPTKYSMFVARDIANLAPFDSEEAINLVVPLEWTKKGLKRSFALIIDKLFNEKQIDNRKVFTARYQLALKANVRALALAYTIYKLRQENPEKGVDDTKKPQHVGEESHKYRLSWADLAIRAKQPNTIGLKEGDVRELTADKRRLATIVATRHYQRAQEYIQAAASTRFPK